MKRKLVSEILIPMYYFFALCPFVSPFRTVSDLQPICLIVSSVILLMTSKKVLFSKFFSTVLLMSMIAFLILIIQDLHSTLYGSHGGLEWGFLSLMLRKCVNYISVLVIGLAGFNIFLQQGGYSEIMIKRMILVWLYFGIAEIFYPNIAQIVLPGARGIFGLGRGVTGLAMEPSFYGYMCFFFFILATKFKTERVKYCVLSVFQNVFLAQSASGSLYFLILAGSYIFLTASIRRKIIYLIVFIITLYVVFSLAERIEMLRSSRMLSLFNSTFNNSASSNVMKNMEEISTKDVSVGARWAAITFGFGSFFSDLGIPHGFIYQGRIMSGYGATLYEMGLIGLALIIMITRRLSKSFGTQASVTVSIVMVAAVQLALPTFAFIVAIAEYERYIAKRASNSAANISAGSRAVMLPN